MASKSTAKKGSSSNRKPTEEVDRISSLPDAIIHHIFSFLHAKEVVTTSLLAKRWRYLWRTAPSLFLDDELFPTEEEEEEEEKEEEEETAFVRFVNGLHSLYVAPKIAMYWLAAQQLKNSTFAESWVHFAVGHNVEQLVVKVQRVPLRMPSCNSLTCMSLKLRGGDLLLPVPGCFSMLETMYLSEVQLPCNRFLDLNSDYCPLLKNLSLKKCVGLLALRVTCANLEYLYIKKCVGFDQLLVSGPKLQTLSVGDSFSDGSRTSLVRIAAPNLETFTWMDFIMDNFWIGKFERLRVAHVSLVIYYYEEMRAPYLRSARKFLQYLASAENIQVEMPCFCFWGLTTNLELLEGMANSPFNLKKLSLLVGPDEFTYRAVSGLFRCFNNLELLHVHTVNDDTEEELSRFPNASALDRGEYAYHIGPLNHLLEVNYCGFKGRQHEMEFIQYLLEHAVILKRMNIVLSPERFHKQKKKMQMTAKFLKLKRTSPEAVVEFKDCND